ncbi:hypothetical protein ACOBQJ_13125 [Pelotomaculum propionicicum]|uniref:hypothetical protein n=1 Tax=Pelotomaculum propionicicum TaxID=258475 RepID=UPI003B7DACED
MTQAELYTALKTLGLPVAYREFKSIPENPAPAPPFICYQFKDDDDIKADNQNYFGINNFDIELYTEKKDPASEASIENMLKTNRLPYTKREFFIESEDLIQVIYEIQLIGG